jgi:DNA topoisomerase-1
VRHQRVFASLPKGMDVLAVDLATALDLLAKKRGRGAPRKTLGDHPDDGEAVTLHDGAYGPYVKHGKTNASLAEGQDPDALTLDEAVALLAAREASKGGGRARKTRATKGGAAKKRPTKAAAQGGAKSGAKSGAKKKGGAAAPTTKATPADLVPFLDQLDAGDRDVVAAIDGIGRPKESLVSVTERLGLSEEDAGAALKRARFKLRMAFGKARKAAE